MSHCSPLGEAAVAVIGVENMEETMVSAQLEHLFGENPATSDGERYTTSPNVEDDLAEGASDNAKLRTCYFGSSTIMVGKLKEMEEKGYFLEDEAHASRAETVPDTNGDKVVIYEDFLSPACAYLRIRLLLIFYCTSRRSCIGEHQTPSHIC
jgi:hypothetical protein